ncbi:MAG: YgaP family membrane protein [Burkholderiaceae bacterium]
MFEKNMGGLDRAIRVVVGIGLIAAAATGSLGQWAYIGIVPILTAEAGSCPAYKLIGLKTCKTSSGS